MYFYTLNCVAKAGVTVCLAMSIKICPAVFIYLLAILHLHWQLRTY